MSFIEQYAKAKSPWLIVNNQVYIADKKGMPITIKGQSFSFSKKDSLQIVERDCALRTLAKNRPLRIDSSIDETASKEIAKHFYNYVETQEVNALKRVIERKKTSLNELLPGFEGYFSNGARVFGLEKTSSAGVLRIKGQNYSIKNVGDSQTINERYDRLLIKNSPVFRESDLRITPMRNGHRMLASLEPFVMKHDKLYSMGACTLGFDFVFGDSFVLKNYPRVFSPSEYKHPFVYPDGEICRGAKRSYKKRGVFTERPYSLSDLELLAFPVAEATRMMRSGYSNKSGPVRLIDGFPTTNLATCKKKKIGVYSHG